MATGEDHEARRIQETLEELCVADLVPNYCTACASGRGCCGQCSDDTSSLEEFELTSKTIYTRSSKDIASYCAINTIKPMAHSSCPPDVVEEPREIFYDDDPQVDEEWRRICDHPLLDHFGDDDRSTFIPCHNSNYDAPDVDRFGGEDHPSDGEILNRLLYPTETFYGDQPLEVILEIIGEEDEMADGCSNPPHVMEKCFHSSPSVSNRRDSLTRTPHGNDVSQDGDCTAPSYVKANALMTEIENCFIETAQIVERTLGHTRNSPTKSGGVNGEFHPEGAATIDGSGGKLSKTVEEALEVFDSIISDHRTRHQCIVDTDQYRGPLLSTTDEGDDGSWGEERPRKDSGNSCERKCRYSFDKDVDELFYQCYDLSAVEPSDSLVSCLRNLENLCLQLRKVRDHILKDIHQNTDQPSSIINEDKLMLINELLERKLKSKLKIETFTVVPPVMGLEGKTHKIIAQVSPSSNVNAENGYQFNEENGDSQDNQSIFERDHDYVNIPPLNSPRGNLTDYQDSAFDSNSDMSIATTYFDSNSSASMSRNLIQMTSDENGYPQSICDSLEDDRIAILSYEESLALYEDNQELQESLLSILHSLNDIHDNFLRRRKTETFLVHESSLLLQNGLRANLSSRVDIDLTAVPSASPPTTVETQDSEVSPGGTLSLIDKMASDEFDSIENIVRVSDELKNLWLYHSRDLISPKQLRRQKPARSASLGRMYRPRRHPTRSRGCGSDFSDDDSSISGQDLSATAESIESFDMNSDFSCSMPNLNTDQFPLSDGISTAVTSHQDDLGDNFNLQMKRENEKCYEVTMNFLKRMMEACQIIEGAPPARPMSGHHFDSSTLLHGIRQRVNPSDTLRPNRNGLYDHNAYMRTC